MFLGEGGKVIWCEGEGSQALNLARAVEWGLPLDCVVSPLSNPVEGFRMDNGNHMVLLFMMCKQPDVRLVILDSLSSLVRGGPAAEKEADVGVQGLERALLKLTYIARATKTPILLTHHLRKRTWMDRDGVLALSRVRGSSKIVQAARVVWMLDAPDAEDRGNRRLAVAKNNLTMMEEPVGMRIGAEGVIFGEAPRVMAEERVSRVEEAAAFLAGFLGGGGRPFVEIEGAFEAAGFSGITVQRAKERLGVVSFRPAGEKGWWWRLGNRE
jgi:hypothetical protein